MDISAMQADGQTKAAAWLATNLPAETTAQPVVASPAVEAPAQNAETPAPKAETPAVTTKPGLADVIRRDREARAAASTAQADAKKYQDELSQLRKENRALKSAQDIRDPLEFVRNRGLTKEEQALWGQALLYDLKPEVAPQEFRLEIYKAQQAAKEAKAAEAAEIERQQAAQYAHQQQIQSYAGELAQHVQTSPEGSHPESEAWFSEEDANGAPGVNHDAYARSLLATANNLAMRAQEAGQQADLSPANVARVLEEEVAKRMKRRDTKVASRAKVEVKQVTPVVAAPGGAQTTTTMSTQGPGGGLPRPAAATDEERVARAAAVLFGTK